MNEIERELKEEYNFQNNFTHIWYKDKIYRAYEELINTDPKKIIKRGWDEWDNLLWWIYWWKLYVIWANTWVGKTTFVNQVCNNVSNQGYRVTKYSLEDRIEDIGKEEIFYTINRLMGRDKKKPIDWISFVNNTCYDEISDYIMKACEILIEKNNLIELDKQKQVSIDELLRLMEEECERWTKLFAIDHLHYFEMADSKERHDIQIQNVMHKLNELARRKNIAIILVAHYRKWSDNDYPSYDEFKDWSAIKQVANIIIQITRDFDNNDGISKFHITKIRWPIKPKILETNFNLSTFEYGFRKSERQLKFERVVV